jgi:hypothetical protein
MGATSGAGTAYSSGASEFNPGFSGVRAIHSLVLCVCFVDRKWIEISLMSLMFINYVPSSCKTMQALNVLNLNILILFDLLCLTPLSARFQLYHDDKV